MNQPGFRNEPHRSKLEHVHEGMKVYDSQDKEIGTVETVFLGSAAPEDTDRGMGPADVSPADEPITDEPLLFDFAFGGTVSPAGDEEHARELIRNRLLMEGYIEVDASGLFASDLFVLADQVESVSEDSVHLSVPRDDLIHRR